MFDSVMEANRAAMDAFAAPGTDGDHAESATERRVEPAGDLPGWETQLDVDGQLSVGDAVRFSKTLSEEDVERFALASGDTNPLHLDEEWAEDTRFSGRIVHGTLAAGLISAALARLPGGVVYLSQDLEFRAPVRIDDRVTAEVEIVEDLGGGRYRLRTTVETDTDLVIDGEAVVLIED
ncbi:MaoC family dehydratase [Natronomonas gomsonensis]|nr:MaoC family dehydratase [Natronomonas gomsonensis]